MFVKPKGIDARIKKIDSAVAFAMARARRLEADAGDPNHHVDRYLETGKFFD
jgi:hypothetical protein